MDKRYIDALNSFAVALDELVESISMQAKQKAKPGGAGTAFGEDVKLSSRLKMIENGIKELKDNDKKIINKQDQILNIAKSIKSAKENNNVFGTVGDKKKEKGIKDGVKTILLIAGSILAIGLAFKLIGGVDFASVIALSIALPLLAIAFEKTAEAMKKITFGKAIEAALVLIVMAGAMALSSYILQYVQPVAPIQMFTAIGIATTFVVVSYSIGMLMKGIKGISIKDIILLPLVLVAMSAAIVGSSYILAATNPIPVDTLINIAEISIALTLVSITMGLGMFVIKKLGLTIGDVVETGISIVAIASVIAASSFVLSLYTPISPANILNIALFSIGLAVSSVVIGLSMFVLNAVGMNPGTAIEGGLTILIIAGTIMASSLILSVGDYSNSIPISWIIGTGLSILGFGLLALGIGTIITSGIGAVAIGLGLVGILAVSATIVATDAILSTRDYKKFPSLAWSLGMVASVGGFTVGAIALGSLIMTGIGAIALAAGLLAIVGIAEALVKTDEILSEGSFKSYPSMQWAEGTSLALKKFASVLGDESFGSLLKNILGNLLGAGPTDIAKSIVEIDRAFSSGSFVKFPSIDWTSGVVKAITDYSTIASNLDHLSESDLKLTASKARLAMAELGFLNLDLNKFAGSAKVGSADNLVNNLMNITKAYDDLANSINNLSSSITNLQKGQLDGLKMITGNIVTLSVIDSDAFDKVMKKIAEHSGTLKDLYSNVNEQIKTSVTESQAVITKTEPAIKTTRVGANTGDKTINDLHQELTNINNTLGLISKHTGSLSSYVNELRGGDVSINH